MLRDLVTGTLPGKARGEIEELLGPSLVTGYFTETKRDLIYFLGPERDNYIRIDSEWLLIWLDTQGRFHHYEIATELDMFPSSHSRTSSSHAIERTVTRRGSRLEEEL